MRTSAWGAGRPPDIASYDADRTPAAAPIPNIAAASPALPSAAGPLSASAAAAPSTATSSPPPAASAAAATAAAPPAAYRGFVAGVFSGIAKLAVGHPFDTIKVRLQTASRAQFSGPIDCVTKTLRQEGWRALYKGATPPLVGWMCMDSLMLGSLTLYRRHLHATVFAAEPTLPTVGHALAGVGAGWTVSFIAAPVEHVKARLQVQYAATKGARRYAGPVDCVRKITHAHGLRGLYHGLAATLLFRTFFCVWWGSYDRLTRLLTAHTALSAPGVNFWAGGLSAQAFWLAAYPADAIKQRLMTDPLGGALGDGVPRYPRWRDAVRAMWARDGPRAFYRGFAPCFLRAFPANAAALVAFEGVLRGWK